MKFIIVHQRMELVYTIVLLRSFPSFSTKIIIYDNDKRIHLLLCLSVVVPIVFVKPETDRYDLFLVETDPYDPFSPVNPMSDNSIIVLPRSHLVCD